MFEYLFNKVVGLKVCIFIKTRVRHRCFTMKLAKFLKTPILTKLCERMLLFEVTSLSIVNAELRKSVK